MAAKANISTGWRIRLGGIAFLFVGMAGWFLYDGFVGYPESNQIWVQFQNFKETKEKEGLTDEVKIREAWNEHAIEKGLPETRMEGEALSNFKKTESEIRNQKIYGFVMIPFGLLLVWAWLKTFTRWVASDDEGVRNSSGQFTPWDKIVKLDKTRWPKKGIAFVHYKDNELELKILLDDFKFDRDPTERIVREVEDKLTDEQIVGDIRETERDKRKAAKAAEEKAKAAGASADSSSDESDDAGDEDQQRTEPKG